MRRLFCLGFLCCFISGAPMLHAGVPRSKPHGDNAAEASPAIREAHSLTLIEDRVSVGTVLARAYKKAASPSAKSSIKEEWLKLAKLFYSDKGFQLYLEGKEFLTKKRYPDAVDRLTESDELEKGNTDVIHYLALAQLQEKNYASALLTVQRGLKVCSIDQELQKDEVALLGLLQKWPDVLKKSEALAHDGAAMTPELLKFRALAFMYEENWNEARILASSMVQKYQQYPDGFYIMGLIDEKTSTDGSSADKIKGAYTQFVNLCGQKGLAMSDRDPTLCGHRDEVEKELK